MSSPKTLSRAAFIAAIVMIWIASFATYSNSFSIAFQFDDTHTVQSNIFVRSLKYVPMYFTDARTYSYRPENSGYRPMSTLACAIGFQLSANETWGYHLVKLIEHCIVASMLFVLGLRLLPRAGVAARLKHGRELVAFFGALVFAVHRANTETVDYITAISTLQAGMFFILAFYCFLRWRESRGQLLRSSSWLVASLLCYLSSMMSKEEGVTLPAMVILYEWIYGRAQDESYVSRLKANVKNWLVLALPYFATAAFFITLRTIIQPASAEESRGSVPVFIYFITQLRSWLHYWSLFFWPVTLNADNLAFDFSSGLDDWRVWASGAVHAAVWAAAWHFGKARRFVLYAVAWVYITVLPASSFFPLVEAVNEHRFYIPYMLLSLLSVWAVFELIGRKSRGAAVALATMASLALAIGAHARNQVWQTDLTLWEDVYEKNPDSPRAMSVLGIGLIHSGELVRSVQLLERCHKIAPRYLPCIVHLSIAYSNLKRYDDGLRILQAGAEINPNYPHVNFHLGLYLKEYYGDYESAAGYFTKVYELTSGRFYQAAIKLAEMKIEDGDLKEAERLAKLILDVDMTNGEAWEIIGRVMIFKGQYADAGIVIRKLLEAVPESSKYRLDLANVYERAKNWQAAAEAYERVVRGDPKAIQGWQGLVRVATELKQPELVEQAKAKVAELKHMGNWNFIPSMLLPGEKPRQTRP